MGERTAISWTDATWSPVTGCSKVSEGCAHCYAERLTRRFGDDFSKVQLHPDRLEQPLRWKKPRRVFVCSMGDLFHKDVPDEFIDRVFATMAQAREHIFQVLTKRPERMRAYLAPGQYRDICVYDVAYGRSPTVPVWPLPNVWLGVSAENQRWADERIPVLLETPAAKRFVSCEPLLGPIDLSGGFSCWCGEGECGHEEAKLDWVIVGGESGGPPERALVERTCQCGDFKSQHCVDGFCEPCHGNIRAPWDNCTEFRPFGWEPKPAALEWVRSLRDQCAVAGVAFHFKQWGGPRPTSGGHLLDGRECREWP